MKEGGRGGGGGPWTKRGAGEGGYWPTGLLASHGRQEGDILPPTTRLHSADSPSSFRVFHR